MCIRDRGDIGCAVELGALAAVPHPVQRNALSFQRGAEAIYTPEGKKQVKAIIQYYMANARIMKEALESTGDVYKRQAWEIRMLSFS